MNNLRLVNLICLSFLSFSLLTGCSGYLAYQDGRDLESEGRYGEATARYFKAVQDNPDNLEYRLKLQETRENAAYEAMQNAASLLEKGQLQAAIEAYNMAYSFDPSQEVALQRKVEIQQQLRLLEMVSEAESLFRERKIAQARQLVAQVLNVDSDFEPALDLKQRVSAVHKTMVAGQELELDSSEPITLKFKKTDIKDAFSVISRLSGITFIYDEDIRSKTFTVYLEQATFAQAMELLLRLNQLDMKVLNPKTILIYPNTRDKKKQYEDQLVQIFYLSNIDAKKAVNMLRTMLTLRKVYVHEELNALVVRDTPVAINLARQMLEAADRADSEVVYDLELISVSRGEDFSFGPKLSRYGASVGFSNPGSGTIVNDSLGDSTANLIAGISSVADLKEFYTLPSASFDMLKSSGGAETLASPRVRVKNKEKAKVHVGTREPVITVTVNGDQTSENIQYVDVGVKLDVEPVIQLDGTIITKISLEVSDATELTPLESGTTPLRIDTTNAQTVLTLKDGERTVIGGLLRENESKSKSGFAFLSDIPLLGNLFSSHDNSENKLEILLSITPHIVRKLNLPSVELATIWSGGEDDLKDGPNFGSFAERFIDDSTPYRPVASEPVERDSEATIADESEGLPAQVAPEVQESTPQVQQEELVEPADNEVEPESIQPEDAAQVPVTQPDEIPENLLEESLSETLPEEGEATVPGETVEEVALPQLEIPAAAIQPKLFFSGASLVDLDETFTLTAEVSEIEGLYSATMFVTYNPEVMEFVDAEEGEFLKQSGVSTIFTVSPNTSRGQLIIGYKQGVEGGGANGSGELFKLQFKALNAGTGQVIFERVNLRDVVGTRIDTSIAGVDVEVR